MKLCRKSYIYNSYKFNYTEESNIIWYNMKRILFLLHKGAIKLYRPNKIIIRFPELYNHDVRYYKALVLL